MHEEEDFARLAFEKLTEQYERRRRMKAAVMDPELMERLAEAAHDVWMEGKLRDGWEYASITDKSNKLHSCLVPYSELSEADKQSDRDLVMGIPEILAKAGLRITSRPLEEV